MKKIKIAFIIDTEGWAFDNIAQNVIPYLKEFEIDIIPGIIFQGNMLRLFLYCQKYDIIHFLWRGYLSLIDSDNLKYEVENYYGMTLDQFKDTYIYNKKISFGVCDHLYLRGEEEWRTDKILKYSNYYFVTSDKLYKIYSEKSIKPQMIIHDGVNLKDYKPENLERFYNPNKLIVGWVGNSKFVDSDNDADMKGVEGIIKPVIKELQEEGYDIELRLADRNIKKISQSDMPTFYNSINLYICASKEEGTPMPVLEAMAMGIPVITTNVGIAEEAFGKLQRELILEERSKECLKEKIKYLIRNKNKYKSLSEENLRQITSFDWSKIGMKYREFFKKLCE